MLVIFPWHNNRNLIRVQQISVTLSERIAVQTEIEPKWITYEEAQRLVGLDHTTLWRLIKSGEIKSAQVGRAVRLSRQSVEAYMERAAEESLSGAQVTYKARPCVAREAEQDVLATVYRFILNCHEGKKAAPEGRPNDAKERSKNDSSARQKYTR
jgi:excisionase family DNA binding protein